MLSVVSNEHLRVLFPVYAVLVCAVDFLFDHLLSFIDRLTAEMADISSSLIVLTCIKSIFSFIS